MNKTLRHKLLKNAMEKHHKVKGAQQDKAHIQLALIVLEVCEEWSQGGSVSNHASTMRWVSEHMLSTAYVRLNTKKGEKRYGYTN